MHSIMDGKQRRRQDKNFSQHDKKNNFHLKLNLKKILKISLHKKRFQQRINITGSLYCLNKKSIKFSKQKLKGFRNIPQRGGVRPYTNHMIIHANEEGNNKDWDAQSIAFEIY